MRTIGVGHAPQALNVLPGGIDGQVAGLNQVVDGFSTFTLSTSLNPSVTAAWIVTSLKEGADLAVGGLETLFDQCVNGLSVAVDRNVQPHAA
jgi:hypothetical protein